MPATPKILALSGSLREGSFNWKLVGIAAAGARAAGAEVTELRLRDLPLPVYDADLEAAEGLPANAAKLKELMVSHDGFLIASPEYNTSLTAALKNAIDWASRKAGDEPPMAAFRGKTAAIMAASPGAVGGLRGLIHLRAILGALQVLVIPDQKVIPHAHEAFDEAGSLRDPKQQQAVERIGARLAEVAGKLRA
jgi:NAD(P)H-dependent FMN reductase